MFKSINRRDYPTVFKSICTLQKLHINPYMDDDLDDFVVDDDENVDYSKAVRWAFGQSALSPILLLWELSMLKREY